MATRSVDVESVAMRMTASADRNPAMVHTAVDTILGLIPVSRARSGLATEARTASPNLVWLEEPPQPERGDGDGDEREELGPAHGDAGSDVPLAVDRRRERGLRGVPVR